jgi:hypothetical protein
MATADLSPILVLGLLGLEQRISQAPRVIMLRGWITLVLAIAALVVFTWRRLTARRAIIAWARREGWRVEDPFQPWPWAHRLPGPRPPGQSCHLVRFAVSGTVRGWPVTVAAFTWTDPLPGNGQPHGPGFSRLIVVVTLPRPYPPASVERRGLGEVPIRRLDRFGRMFRTPPADAGGARALADAGGAGALAAPALLNALLAGRACSWSIQGTDLLGVFPAFWLPRPGTMISAANRAVRVAELLTGDTA